MRFLISLIGVGLAAAGTAQAAEPRFCEPEAFLRHEVAQSSPAKRLHLFRLGRVKLAGLGVGSSENGDVRELARENSEARGSEGFCTWYLNRKDEEAVRTFNWRYLPRPERDGTADEIAAQYERILAGAFSGDATSFLSCVEQYGYLALGCDEMKHRGPTAFAMFLSFVGCSPEHSVEIVNRRWGENGVTPATRLAVARKGEELGRRDATVRVRFQALLTAEK